MPLGFARDSVLDLAAMARDDDEPSLSALGTTPQIEGESAEISLFFTDDANPSTNIGTNSDAADSESSGQCIDDNPAPSQYSGFSVHYADYEKDNEMTYDVDPYAPTIFGGANPNEAGLWCCLFPWVTPKQLEMEESQVQVETKSPSQPSLRSRCTVDASGSEETDDDEVSTGSSVAYGEKLTDKDRLAVVARLRISQTPDSQTAQKLLNGIQHQSKEDRNGAKGILKRGSGALNQKTSGAATGQLQLSLAEHGNQARRSLFPQYDEKKSTKLEERVQHHVSFSPMARVVTVKSRADMTYMEKALVWWQKQDYEDFKKTGRIIAKAMLEGGSEVWLATNKSWQIKPHTNLNSSPHTRSYHMSDRSEIVRGQNPGQVSAEGNKWWNEFGHSRRGLEHIASGEEGRQRQANVRTAIRMVVEEQRRQKIYRKDDTEKIRMVSLQYTIWARDLALAAAESDTEAVRSNFSHQAKTREYYLLKQGLDNVMSNNAKQMPAFMMPIGVSPQMLDENTSSQIRYRRKLVETPQQLARKVLDPAKAEPIHDPDQNKSNLAKQAAGYGVADSDMSKVLIGMGVGVEPAGDSTKPMTLPSQTSVGAH